MTTTPKPDITRNLNELGDECLKLSRRWFPELFERGLRELVAHYGLGLIGEVGEVEELLESGRPISELGNELADVLTYAVELSRVLELDVHHATHHPYLLQQSTGLVAIGLMANAVKKLHRGRELDLTDPGDITDAELGLMLEVKNGCGWAIRRVLYLADRHDIDLSEAWHAKMRELEARWGGGLPVEAASAWIEAPHA